MKRFNRLLAFGLVFCMLFSLAPTSVYATELSDDTVLVKAASQEAISLDTEETEPEEYEKEEILENDTEEPSLTREDDSEESSLIVEDDANGLTAEQEKTPESEDASREVEDDLAELTTEKETNPVAEDESLDESLRFEEESQMLQDAEEFISGNLKFVKNDNGDACVTGFANEVANLVIPSTVDGLKVAGIAYEAFQHNQTITSLKIPSTLEYINGYAFLDCPKLRTVTIEAGNLKYIEHMAFSSCKALSSVTIGAGVKELRSDAFYNDAGITEITIPNTVTKIEEGVFRENNLSSVTIPASVTYIGGSAFYGNKNLYSINILGNPEYDGNPFGGTAWNEAQGDFPIMKGVLLDYNGDNPVEITVPSNVKKINVAVFMYKHTLEKVILPTGLTEIGESAFWYCDKLSYINLPSTLRIIGAGAFCGTQLTSVNIPQGVTEIPVQAFIQNRKLTKVTIPDTVTKIGGAAFAECSSLTSVTLPKNLIEIDQEAFDESGLTSITIPDTVTRIGMYAFHACKNLRSVTIGSGVTTIEKYAFCDCNELKQIDVPGNVTSIGERAFGYYEYDIRDYRPVPGFQMSGVNGSKANTYALTNNFPFTGRAPEGTEQPDIPDVPEIKPFGSPEITVNNIENGIRIKWNLLEGATQYVIERRIGIYSDFEKLKTVDNATYYYDNVISTSGYNSSYVHPGLYITYRVYAYKGTVKSEYSNLANIYYLRKPEITSLTNVSNGVKISWMDESGARQMEIYRKTGSGEFTKIATANGYGITSFTDTSIKAGTSYTYKIRGAVWDEEDNENYTSVYSDVETITTNEPAPEPHKHTLFNAITEASFTSDGEVVTKCADCGEVTKRVTISHPEIFKLSSTSFAYTGSAVKPTVTVVDSKGNTISSTNYSLSYCNAAGSVVTPTAVGAYVVKVTMKGNYTGTESLNYNIVPKKTTIGSPAIAYDGITVKWTKNTSGAGYYIYRSVNGASYSKVKTITSNATVSWKDTTAKTNGNKYQYKIVAYKKIGDVTYKSASSSVKTICFLTRPAISSLTNSGTRKMTVKWAKNSKASGYQIQYGLVKDFSKKTTVSISGASTVSKAISSLTKGKTYYVRMRTYKTVSGTKYYSAWSATKSVKITR